MKKLIFAALAVLLTLIVTSCNDLTTSEGFDVPYIITSDSNGVKSVELSLDRTNIGKSANNYRALSQPLADYGIDFFEVVFVGFGTDNIARASWIIGDSVSIRDVPGTEDTYGYDYAYTSISTPTTPSAPTSTAAGIGKAVLFAGRQDGTLLAVGKVTKVNGAGVTIIKSTSKTVTFGLAALTGNFSTVTIGGSPAPVMNTDYKFIKANYLTYPQFDALAFLPNLTGTATYTFASSATTELPFSAMFNSFGPPVAGTSTVTKVTASRYELPAGNFVELKGAAALPILAEDTPLASSGAIIFSLTTGAAQGIASFTFSIPFSALSNDPGLNSVPAVQWFIKPGYKNHLLDVGGTGGALLFYIASPLPDTLNFNSLGILIENL